MLAEFEAAVVGQFRPNDHVERVRAKFPSARQRGVDVGRFVAYLDELLNEDMELGKEIAESEKLERFKAGLIRREAGQRLTKKRNRWR